MTGHRLEATFWLYTKYRVKVCQYWQKAGDVGSISAVNQIDVVRVDGSAVQNSGEAANNHEFHASLRTAAQNRGKLTRDHLSREWREGRWCDPRQTAAARRE